jgi:tetratricopeptide (TPR) repeat protein
MKTFNIIILCLSVCLAANVIFAQGQPTLTKVGANNQQNIETAQALLQNGDAQGAISFLQTALQKEPQNNLLTYWLGKAFYAQGNYQKTIESLSLVYASLAEKSAEKVQATQMLGLSHYVLGHLADAIPYFEKMPENAEISYALGVSYIQTRQPEKSRQTFSRLFGVQPNTAAAHLLNAQMLIRQKFEETAEIELNKALTLDPKLPHVRFLLGEMAIYRADIDKGIMYLREEITINPANGMAYYRLGEALSRQLKWDEAIEPLQKSIWINPFFSGPYIVLGKVYLKKKDLGNAESLLRRSVALDPRNFGAHHLLGQVLQQAGRAEEAKAVFELAEKLRGQNEQNPI